MAITPHMKMAYHIQKFFFSPNRRFLSVIATMPDGDDYNSAYNLYLPQEHVPGKIKKKIHYHSFDFSEKKKYNINNLLNHMILIGLVRL